MRTREEDRKRAQEGRVEEKQITCVAGAVQAARLAVEEKWPVSRELLLHWHALQLALEHANELVGALVNNSAIEQLESALRRVERRVSSYVLDFVV